FKELEEPGITQRSPSPSLGFFAFHQHAPGPRRLAAKRGIQSFNRAFDLRRLGQYRGADIDGSLPPLRQEHPPRDHERSAKEAVSGIRRLGLLGRDDLQVASVDSRLETED